MIANVQPELRQGTQLSRQRWTPVNDHGVVVKRNLTHKTQPHLGIWMHCFPFLSSKQMAHENAVLAKDECI